jgi:cell wall assembly regulator SMI1
MPIQYRPAAPAADIDKLERASGAVLPEDYKAFLRRHNGLAIGSPGYCQLPFQKVDDGEIAFANLFGVELGKSPMDIGAFNREFISEIAFVGKVLAIGDDGGDNPYVLRLDQAPGTILYWDRTHLHRADRGRVDIPERDDCGNLHEVCATFTDFLALVERHAV